MYKQGYGLFPLRQLRRRRSGAGGQRFPYRETPSPRRNFSASVVAVAFGHGPHGYHGWLLASSLRRVAPRGSTFGSLPVMGSPCSRWTVRLQCHQLPKERSKTGSPVPGSDREKKRGGRTLLQSKTPYGEGQVGVPDSSDKVNTWDEKHL